MVDRSCDKIIAGIDSAQCDSTPKYVFPLLLTVSLMLSLLSNKYYQSFSIIHSLTSVSCGVEIKIGEHLTPI